VIAGPLRLIGAEFSAEAIVDPSILSDALTTWEIALPSERLAMLKAGQFGPGVVPKPWEFQETTNVHHHSGHGYWGEQPCWVIEIYDRQSANRGLAAPRGPFKNFQHGFYAEDLGAAVEQWAADPMARDSSAVQDSYRIVLPDHRGFIADLKRQGNELHVRVEGAKVQSLMCALTVRDHRGVQSRLSAPVKSNRAVFQLPVLTRSVELFVFDESESWCDAYTESEGQKSWGRAIAVVADGEGTTAPDEGAAFPSVALPVTDLLLSPRYGGPQASFAKALEFSSGPKQDLPNAAKEAICAVEGIGRIVTGLRTATLGEILKHLKSSGRLDPAIGRAFEALWGYANRSPGVRHGDVIAPTISASEARLVVDMSAAAIRYLLNLDTLDPGQSAAVTSRRRKRGRT
jgi:hypothetical protein